MHSSRKKNTVGNSTQHSLEYNKKRKKKYNTDEVFRKKECQRIRKSKQKRKEAISLRVAEQPAGGKDKRKQGVARGQTKRNRKDYTTTYYSTNGQAIRRRRKISYHCNLLRKHTLKMEHHLAKLADLGYNTADSKTYTQSNNSLTVSTDVGSNSIFNSTATVLEVSAVKAGTAVTTFSSGSSTDSSTPPSPVKIRCKKISRNKIRQPALLFDDNE